MTSNFAKDLSNNPLKDLEDNLNLKESEMKQSVESYKFSPKIEINELDDEEEQYYFDYENEDLCKLDNDELQKHKDVMEKEYLKRAVLPGDKNFEYDVQKDFDFDKFSPDWDESSEF